MKMHTYIKFYFQYFVLKQSLTYYIILVNTNIINYKETQCHCDTVWILKL